MHIIEIQVGPTWRIAITVCPRVGLYNMRTTGAPMSRAEILLPVNASNSAHMETNQLGTPYQKYVKNEIMQQKKR